MWCVRGQRVFCLAVQSPAPVSKWTTLCLCAPGREGLSGRPMAPRSEWLDVSIPITPAMHAWPDSPPTTVTPHLAIAQGDVCNVSTIHFNSHCGTHMDAPLHFLAKGVSMDALPWDAVIGPARLIEVTDSESIKPAALRRLKLKAGARVLFKTRNSTRSWKKPGFDKDFVYISKEAAAYLVDCGVQTVGVDYLSVGGFYKDGIETHHILLGAGMWIIEGLDFRKARPGNHDLLCLPLRLLGADGAPARCLIRRRSR
jgi:arylformamidase